MSVGASAGIARTFATGVPNAPLETIVREQARKVAKRRMQSVEHSMLLEDQSVPAKDFEERIDALARDMNPRALWDDT